HLPTGLSTGDGTGSAATAAVARATAATRTADRTRVAISLLHDHDGLHVAVQGAPEAIPPRDAHGDTEPIPRLVRHDVRGGGAEVEGVVAGVGPGGGGLGGWICGGQLVPAVPRQG